MLLEDLKQQTRHQHTELEQLNNLPASLQDYLVQLELFYGFIAPWERRLAETLEEDDPVRGGREKTAWLEADLAFFGYTAREIGALPQCHDLPPTDTREQILGAAYVIEGSTLGGQLISRHLTQALGLSPGGGDQYFRSYGPAVGPMWQAFRQQLLSYSSPQADPVIVAAAQDMFARLHAWFASRKVGV